MTLTTEQGVVAEAIIAGVRRQREEGVDGKASVLSGAAGTGKTRLLVEIQKDLSHDFKKPLFVAFTGKACSVLKAKGAEQVSTIHKLLYAPLPASQENLKELLRSRARYISEDLPEKVRDVELEIKREKDRLEQAFGWEKLQGGSRALVATSSCVVVDEASMMTEEMLKDILELGLPVYCALDENQLPPVRQKAPQLTPDWTLTKIHRQAEESPVLNLAYKILAAEVSDLKNRDWWSKAEALLCNKISEVAYDLDKENTILITGKNEPRRKINKFLRHKYGYTEQGLIAQTEKLCALRNRYDQSVFNGQVFVANNVERVGINDWGIRSSGLEEGYILAWDGVLTGDDLMDCPQSLCPVDYGYAITAHKAQGSEWDEVAIHPAAPESTNFKKWIYTAVTRAKQRVLLIWPEA